MKIDDFLFICRISRRYKGCRYIKYAIELINEVEDDEIYLITKDIYPCLMNHTYVYWILTFSIDFYNYIQSHVYWNNQDIASWYLAITETDSLVSENTSSNILQKSSTSIKLTVLNK